MAKAGQAAKYTRYFTGQACKKGHVAERMTSSRNCVECLKLSKKKWNKNNLPKVKYYEKNAVYKRKYGISLKDYELYHKKQEGKCLICNQLETAVYKGKLRMLAVDHNHETGEFRGLICSWCNMGLGSFKDNPELLWKARKYLKEKGFSTKLLNK